MGTENVKLGTCQVIYNGVDLGYTKGGVEVEVSTDTHKVTLDQFGESEVNEIIMKRSVMARVPMAETTLDNLVMIMPGATLIDSGTKQAYTVDEAAPASNELYTLSIGTKSYTYTSDISATETEILAGLALSVNGDPLRIMDADASGSSLVLTARSSGVTHVVSVTGGAASASETTTATAGVKRVDVTNGIGTDLLSIAKKLVLHPAVNAADDESEDFTIYKAATPGAMSFTYKIDEERTFPIEFTGYPDLTNKIFSVGDSTAV